MVLPGPDASLGFRLEDEMDTYCIMSIGVYLSRYVFIAMSELRSFKQPTRLLLIYWYDSESPQMQQHDISFLV
jgi:hypothetical protein